MNFWQWIFSQGLPDLKGDWRAYATGKHSTGTKVTQAEYRNALSIIMNHVVAARRPGSGYNIAFPGIAMEMLRAAGGLVNDSEIAYWAGQSSPEELAGFLDTVSGRLATSAGTTSSPAAPARPPAPRPATPAPAPPPRPATPPTPTPPPATTPDAPEPIDWQARVRAYYPWLPESLVGMFADSWSETGDPIIALADVRASGEYDQIFPGIKRADGTLRMDEQEWFSTREAYGTLFREYGLNDSLFTDRFTELMEGDVSPAELAGRLGGAYEQIIGNTDGVRQAYSQWFGSTGMSDAAIFASFIDADVADAILNRRVSIAQVGGEGLARGLDVDFGFAERLVEGGVDQGQARQLFSTFTDQGGIIDRLMRRHFDPNDAFTIEEFADAQVFGDAEQLQAIRRVFRAEESMFADQLGGISMSDSGALTGLRAR
jgi:hypothetical protein